MFKDIFNFIKEKLECKKQGLLCISIGILGLSEETRKARYKQVTELFHEAPKFNQLRNNYEMLFMENNNNINISFEIIPYKHFSRDINTMAEYEIYEYLETANMKKLKN